MLWILDCYNLPNDNHGFPTVSYVVPSLVADPKKAVNKARKHFDKVEAVMFSKGVNPQLCPEEWLEEYK